MDGRWDAAVIGGELSPDGTDIILSVTGGDWQLQEAQQSLRHLTVLPRVVKSRYDGRLFVPCTWAVITQLARLCERHSHVWRPDPYLNKWIEQEFLRRFTEDGDLAADFSALEREPMPHQKAGAFVAGMNKRFFFGDDAGTGKTMTMLMTLAELEARGEDPFPAFVVAPASVVDPWLEELEECFPDWPAVAYSGAKRKLLSTRYKVYVMSWAVFRDDMNAGVFGVCQCEGRVKWTKAMQKAWDEGNPPVCTDCGTCYEIYDANKHELPPLIKFLPPKSLVLDEAHCLCNTTTRQTTAAKRCARIVPNLLLASGTPITHDVGGFHSAMSALDIRSFPNADRFKEQYADTSRSDYGNPQKVEGLTTVNREEFFTVLQGSFRHTSKLDVLKDLPPKTYSTRVVEIPGAYRVAYDEMQRDMIAHLPDTDEPLEVMSTLVQLQRLTQLASSACDVEYVETDEWDEELQALKIQVNVTMREPCWKVDDLMAVMDDNQGQPIVTFAPHTQLINIAGARAEKAGYRVGYIKGGQTRTARTAVRRAFQAGETDLLCCNVASGGVGLTLTASHIVVMLERPFAFWQASQSEDRVHRRGQTEQVHIIDIVAANSVESRVRAALKEKAGHLSDLVRDERIVRELLGGQPIHI